MNKFHKDWETLKCFSDLICRKEGIKPKLFFHVGKGEGNSVKPKNYRFWFLSPASGWFVEWAFKQIMANMGRYHVRHHVANPLIARPQSSYNKMIQPPDRMIEI